MRWKVKTIPKVGDTRKRFPFAWTPITIGNYTLWLERYYIKEKLVLVCEQDDFVVHPVEGWVEIDRGLLY